jgi:hypothetical protein
VFLQDISTKAADPAPAQFEDLLPAAHWVPLPREAQVSSQTLHVGPGVTLIDFSWLLFCKRSFLC